MLLKQVVKKISKFKFTSNPLVEKTNLVKRSYHAPDEVLSFTTIHMKKILKSSNVSFTEGHACVIAQCSLCNASRIKECKIYINRTTGFFVCEICHRTGAWSTLELFLQPKKSKKALEESERIKNELEVLPDLKKEWKSLKLVSSLQTISEDDYNNIWSGFNMQPLPRNVMSQMDVLYINESKTLYFPILAFNNTIVGYKTISLNSLDLIEKTTPVVNASGIIIYRQRNLKCDSPAIVVHSLEDLLAVLSQKASSLIICLPHGLKSVPQQLLPSLENYDKLILWFGNDTASWDCAKHFSKKFGERRCDFVRPIDRQPRPKIALKLGYDFKKIIENAQPIWHKSITTFHSLRQDVLSELQNNDKVQGVKWTRYPTLNKILKGHRRGEFTVLTGPTGCGKTTFMSEYSLDLALQGVNTLWGSFEIRNARLAKTMLQQMVGVPLDENLEKFDIYADEFEKLPIYFMTFHGQQNIKDVMEAVEHATYVHDIAHVIIDNVQFMMGMADEPKFMDRFWKQDKIIAAFRQFATKFNCHVTLVIHPRKEKEEDELTTASIFGGAKASQEADNILIIQDKRLTSVRGKKFLQVAKNRFSGDLGIMMLEFDKESLGYAQKKKSKTDT